ncbi:hypothetical protein F5Y16DRAFT_370552 [Xylariaceae sp. FL0255]|nr:hypothetical protein F5Y16DRAFT_370552 [Xylariaceae sp. FL0255]
MRPFYLPTPLLLVLLLQTGSSLAVTNDFSAYPQASQQCLTNSADQAGCESADTGADLNQCLCKNKNNFIYNVASCVAKNDPKDLTSVYDTLSSNCAGTGVTLSVSQAAFMAQASAATATTSPSATPTSTPAASGSNSGLSMGAKIGIGVAIGFGVIAVILAVWFLMLYQRRRRSRDSIHSREPENGGGDGGFGAAGLKTRDEPGSPPNEYANDNVHHGAAELAPVEWKPSSGYGTSPYGSDERKTDDAKASVPLLAELSSGPQMVPVELPASEGYLGYSDRVGDSSNRQHSAVSPVGSSVGYSHEARTMSPVSASQYSSNGGTS